MISFLLTCAFLALIVGGIFHALFIPYDHNPRKGFMAKVVEYSLNGMVDGYEVTTFHLRYPRFIHSEMMTHKDFSRSASSSRAIPILTMLKQVWYDPAMPIAWGVNQPGMQASQNLTGWKLNLAQRVWVWTGRVVCAFVYVLYKLNLHKQVGNRLLEPWQWMNVTLTTSKLNNFFHLRIHKDAQPEIRYLAELMKLAKDRATPKVLRTGEWHLPWILEQDRLYAREMSNTSNQGYWDILKKMSAARCARSSYNTFDGELSPVKDMSLYGKLVDSEPVHASPCEHQCAPDTMTDGVWDMGATHGNTTGFIQHRNLIPNHYIPG